MIIKYITTGGNIKYETELFTNKRTIRKFKNKEVPKEVIQQIIEAGRFTPTARNSQDVSYIVLNEEKNKYEKIRITMHKLEI